MEAADCRKLWNEQTFLKFRRSCTKICRKIFSLNFQPEIILHKVLCECKIKFSFETFMFPASVMKEELCTKFFYCLLIFHISSSRLSIGKCLMPRMAQIQDEAFTNISWTAASRQNQEAGNIYSKIFTAQDCHKLRQKRWWKENLNFNVCFLPGDGRSFHLYFQMIFFRSHDHKSPALLFFCFSLDYSNFQSHIKIFNWNGYFSFNDPLNARNRNYFLKSFPRAASCWKQVSLLKFSSIAKLLIITFVKCLEVLLHALISI